MVHVPHFKNCWFSRFLMWLDGSIDLCVRANEGQHENNKHESCELDMHCSNQIKDTMLITTVPICFSQVTFSCYGQGLFQFKR